MTKRQLSGVVKEARQGLGMTQRDLAARIGVEASHIAYIENGHRRPSLTLVRRLADTLLLDRRELFLLAHPEAKHLVGSLGGSAPTKRTDDAFRLFASNRRVLKRHGVTRAELRLLKQVSLLDPVSSPGHFLFILNSISQAATTDLWTTRKTSL
jgi:transcriptional regulator with XRE-family HTH domain